MIARVITSRKRATRTCIMTRPLCLARAIHPNKGVILAQYLLRALVLGLALAQSAGATTITMWLRMTASHVCSQNADTRTPPRVMMVDISITLTWQYHFCHLLRSNGKDSEIGNCASREFMCPIICLCSRYGTKTF
jgi:hypothetical protein